jgi:glutamyl-tRNA synthetase
VTDGPRYRIAPSPTGFFHVGGARTALYNWALAKSSGGTFVLRIEDTDEARNRPEWTEGIIDALAWIGITSTDPVFEGPYFQSEYLEQHVATAQRLFAEGRAYYCDLAPEQVQERAKASGKPGYDGYSRDRGLGPAPGNVLRFRVPDGTTVVRDVIRGDVVFENSTIEDFVLLRGNGTPVFLLANVVDDIEMRISHVVRGEEHLPNTPKQQMLWEALGVTPPVWAHVPVVVNEQRKKLSKRRDKVALEAYRDEGYLAVAMVNYLMTLGWAPKGDTEIVPWKVIEDSFRLEDVTPSPAYFDLKKLAAFNGDYIRMMPVEEFVVLCEPWLARWRDEHPEAVWDQSVFEAMAPLVQTRVVTLAEAPAYVDFLFMPDAPMDDAAVAKAIASPSAAEVIADTIAAYGTCEWTPAVMKEQFDTIAERHGLKAGKAQTPVRVAVTGRTIGPPLYEAMELLGRERTLARLRRFAELLGS